MKTGNGVWLAVLILLLSLAVALATWWLGGRYGVSQAGGGTGGGDSLFVGRPLELRLTQGARLAGAAAARRAPVADSPGPGTPADADG